MPGMSGDVKIFGSSPIDWYTGLAGRPRLVSLADMVVIKRGINLLGIAPVADAVSEQMDDQLIDRIENEDPVVFDQECSNQECRDCNLYGQRGSHQVGQLSSSC